MLRDRIDGNIKNLHQTLNATLDLKRQLEALGTAVDIPPDLMNAVKAEILPEYIENARHEQLKTYLIIILVVSALTSAILPSEIGIIIQIPLLVMGGFCLFRLLKTYAARAVHSSDESTLKMMALGLVAGTLTTAGIGIALYSNTLYHVQYFHPDKVFVALFAIALGLFIIGGGIWLAKTRSRMVWRIASAALSLPGLVFCLFGFALIYDAMDSSYSREAKYTVLLSVLGAITAVFLFSAMSMFNRLKLLRRPPPTTPVA